LINPKELKLENMLLDYVGEGSASNKAENLFRNKAKSKGWLVVKKEWPDFMCYKIDEFTGEITDVMCVEVKKSFHDKLHDHQAKMLYLLFKLGIKSYIWSEKDEALRPIKQEELEMKPPPPAHKPKVVNAPLSAGAINYDLYYHNHNVRYINAPHHARSIRQKLREK
jgi:hypothetical protein